MNTFRQALGLTLLVPVGLIGVAALLFAGVAGGIFLLLLGVAKLILDWVEGT